MNLRLLFASLGAAVLLSSSSYAQGSKLTANDLAEFTPIAEGIRRADSFTLFEGLPHQSAEAELLQKELANKETIRLHGYPFYKRPLSLADEKAKRLRRLCTAADSFWSYGGPKFCGGFHPDYCLAWKDGDASYELLCFVSIATR